MGASHNLRRVFFFFFFFLLVPRSEWDFSRMLIVMSVKPTLIDELLKVNSALKLIFSVIGDQCSGGQ